MTPEEIRFEMARLKTELEDNKKERRRIIASNPGLKRNRTARKEMLRRQRQLMDECPHTNIFLSGNCQDCGESSGEDGWR